MSREVVFDIETQNTFKDVGEGNHKGLKISVVGIYTSHDDRYWTVEEPQLNELWPVLEQADCIIGYNSKGFDLPVLNNYYSGDLLRFPNLDLLEEVKKSLGFRLRLDAVAQATLNIAKSGHGLQAVEWWKQGEIEKIKKYCLDDVRITKLLYDYGKSYKKLQYMDLNVLKSFPVNFVLTQMRQSINLTLPL